MFRIITSKADLLQRFVVLEPWNVSERRDEYYSMPVLCRNHEDTYFSVSPKVCCVRYRAISFRNSQPLQQDIYFTFNAQHDCKSGGCQLAETNLFQEHKETSKTQLAVKHSNVDRYIINLHAHHNAWRLRKVLPRNLTAPTPYTSDRQKFHDEAAQRLQKENPAKRAEAAAKARATRARKKEEPDAKE